MKPLVVAGVTCLRRRVGRRKWRERVEEVGADRFREIPDSAEQSTVHRELGWLLRDHQGVLVRSVHPVTPCSLECHPREKFFRPLLQGSCRTKEHLRGVSRMDTSLDLSTQGA